MYRFKNETVKFFMKITYSFVANMSKQKIQIVSCHFDFEEKPIFS